MISGTTARPCSLPPDVRQKRCSISGSPRFLGHASASETLDTYGHLWPDDGDRIKAAVDQAFGETEEPLRNLGSGARTQHTVSPGCDVCAVARRPISGILWPASGPVTIHLCDLPEGAVSSERAAQSLCSVLLRMGFTKPATSP